MFINSGFSRHWKKIFSQANGTGYDSDIAKRILAGYRRSLVLPTPVMSEEELVNNIVDLNETHNLRTEVREGTLHIIQGTWDRAKEYIGSVDSFSDTALG